MVEARLAQHDATLDLHEAAISLMQGAAEEAGVAFQRYEVQHAQSQTPPPPPVEQRSVQTTELDELPPVWAVWDASRDANLMEAARIRRHRLGLPVEAAAASGSGEARGSSGGRTERARTPRHNLWIRESDL